MKQPELPECEPLEKYNSPEAIARLNVNLAIVIFRRMGEQVLTAMADYEYDEESARSAELAFVLLAGKFVDVLGFAEVAAWIEQGTGNVEVCVTLPKIHGQVTYSMARLRVSWWRTWWWRIAQRWARRTE